MQSQIFFTYNLFLGLLLAVCLPLTTFAQTSSTPLAPMSEQPERVSNPATEISNARVSLDSRVQARIINLAANISTRMENTIARLENIAARLESRRSLIAANGLNTDVSQIELFVATTALESAKTRLVTIDDAVVTAVATTDPQIAWRAVRSTYQSTRLDIVSAHEALIRAVESLKNPTPSAPATTSSAIIE